MTMGRSQRCTAITLMGLGEFQSKLEGAGIASGCKTQSPTAAGALFTKDRFDIDLGAARYLPQQCQRGYPPWP